MNFNLAPATVMHIDLNSCFATVEQQANPLLRGKPVVVAAYTTDRGCILAASIEAKRLGIKTGMRVGEGKTIYPKLIVLPSDPEKYRFVNHQLVKLLSEYTPNIIVKSIDEMVMELEGAPYLSSHAREIPLCRLTDRDDKLVTVNDNTIVIIKIGKEIKQRIRAEIGEWLMVSIGIAPNHYLAKIASTLHKPDGLDVIDSTNIEEILRKLKLEELNGIKAGYGGRLRAYGIDTALKMYQASGAQLKLALNSITGQEWRLRLHGYPALDWEFERKSVGHSYALYKAFMPDDVRLLQILCQLVEKMGRRLREYGFTAGGLHVSCLYSDYTHWQHGQKLATPLYANTDLYQGTLKILLNAPNRPVRILAVSCFNLVEKDTGQMSLFPNEQKKQALTQALDKVADRFGEFTVTPARMLGMEHRVLDRIAFGRTSH